MWIIGVILGGVSYGLRRYITKKMREAEAEEKKAAYEAQTERFRDFYNVRDRMRQDYEEKRDRLYAEHEQEVARMRANWDRGFEAEERAIEVDVIEPDRVKPSELVSRFPRLR